ncbi:MAG: DUF721 domain-containing protein [Hyphomicrobiaceae bacterium]
MTHNQPPIAANRPTATAMPAGIRASVSARPVGSFIARLTRKAMEKYGFSAAQLITDWALIVGPELARHTEPQRLKWPRAVNAYAETEEGAAGRPGAILYLRVDAARALDVQYSSHLIIDRINGYFGSRAIASIKILQAPALPVETSSSRRPGPLRKTSAPKASIDLNAVADERLRTALERLQRNIAGG